MSAPRLSFCIATLNRAEFLAQTLDALIAQATAEVEIVVVDGASTDHTPQVVAERQARFARLRYLRLAQKGGVDQDYSRAVALAQGEYCWLFSDDDLLKAGAVARVLQALPAGDDVIVVNAECRDASLTQVVQARRLPIVGDRTYSPAENLWFFNDVVYYVSFIGALVIRRDLWESRDIEPYWGTAFVHIGILFQRPLERTARVIAEPLIIIRLGNAEWSARAFEIWILKWPALIWSFTHYPEAARAKVAAREPWRKLTTLLRYRARGAYSLGVYNKLLRPIIMPAWQCAGAWLIACLPECVANIIGLLYYSLIRHSPIELVDLRASRAYYRKCLARLFNGVW